jgi:hypothetical protein
MPATCQDHSNCGQLKPQIGKRVRRLSLMQQGHICVESGRNARHLSGGRRAHPQHQARLKTGQVEPMALQSGKMPSNGRGSIQAPGR